MQCKQHDAAQHSTAHMRASTTVRQHQHNTAERRRNAAQHSHAPPPQDVRRQPAPALHHTQPNSHQLPAAQPAQQCRRRLAYWQCTRLVTSCEAIHTAWRTSTAERVNKPGKNLMCIIAALCWYIWLREACHQRQAISKRRAKDGELASACPTQTARLPLASFLRT